MGANFGAYLARPAAQRCIRSRMTASRKIRKSEGFPRSRSMVTGQIEWSGAGSNRRPSAFQA
jgi:hypothetical protein